MILQYRGFNNNWCFEEAETIIYANVLVGKETRDYRENGERWQIHQEELKKCADSKEEYELKLKFVQEIHNAVDKLIKKETNCSNDIIYNIDCPFVEMESVCVVTLKDKSQIITRVFNIADMSDKYHKDVYLLNNRGQTVQRLV